LLDDWWPNAEGLACAQRHGLDPHHPDEGVPAFRDWVRKGSVRSNDWQATWRTSWCRRHRASKAGKRDRRAEDQAWIAAQLVEMQTGAARQPFAWEALR